nr:uncharacterized protein CI109_006315 [Kwoniella shandongensis]KAA5525336.1 hypothetical protein CI109_006315 [Kwoniella shandongensis]
MLSDSTTAQTNGASEASTITSTHGLTCHPSGDSYKPTKIRRGSKEVGGFCRNEKKYNQWEIDGNTDGGFKDFTGTFGHVTEKMELEDDHCQRLKNGLEVIHSMFWASQQNPSNSNRSSEEISADLNI